MTLLYVPLKEGGPSTDAKSRQRMTAFVQVCPGILRQDQAISNFIFLVGFLMGRLWAQEQSSSSSQARLSDVRERQTQFRWSSIKYMVNFSFENEHFHKQMIPPTSFFREPLDQF
jgi:hypothetical protein